MCRRRLLALCLLLPTVLGAMDDGCRLPSTSWSRDHQLQQVLQVLQQVRLSKQELSSGQLSLLTQQLRRLYQCIMASKQPQHHGPWQFQDHFISSRQDASRPYSEQELVDQNALDELQGYRLSSNATLDLDLSQQEALNAIEQVEYAVQKSKLKKQPDMSVKNKKQRHQTTVHLEPFTEAVKQADWTTSNHIQQKPGPAQPVAYQEGYFIPYQPGVPGVITPYQSVGGGAIGALDGADSTLLDDLQSLAAGVVEGDSGLLFPDEHHHPHPGDCQCLGRGAMLGLLAAGVAATGLTAYINALFQQRAGKQVQRLPHELLARTLLQETCALGGQQFSRRLSGDSTEPSAELRKSVRHRSDRDYPHDWKHILRRKREVAATEDGESGNHYHMIKFSMMDAPMRKSAHDPGPFPLFTIIPPDRYSDFEEEPTENPVKLAVSPTEHTEHKTLPPKQTAVHPAALPEYDNVFSEYEETPADPEEEHVEAYPGHMKEAAVQEHDGYGKEEDYEYVDLTEGYIKNSLGEIAESPLHFRTPETTMDIPPVETAQNEQLIVNEQILVDQLTGATESTGIIARPEGPPIETEPTVLDPTVLTDRTSQVFSSSVAATAGRTGFNIVMNMLNGLAPDLGFGPFQQLLTLFESPDASAGGKRRSAKQRIKKPLAQISKFFKYQARRNLTVSSAHSCHCVTLTTKQLGAIGSPVQALVMSGVVIGYIIIQALAIYSRNGKKLDDEGLDVDAVLAAVGPMLMGNGAREMKTAEKSSDQRWLMNHFRRMLHQVGGDVPVLRELRRAIETPSIDCGRYYMCEASRQASLAGEPFSVVVPLLQLPLSWMLEGTRGGAFRSYCTSGAQTTDCSQYRQRCQAARK